MSTTPKRGSKPSLGIENGCFRRLFDARSACGILLRTRNLYYFFSLYMLCFIKEPVSSTSVSFLNPVWLDNSAILGLLWLRPDASIFVGSGFVLIPRRRIIGLVLRPVLHLHKRAFLQNRSDGDKPTFAQKFDFSVELLP